MKRSTLLFMIFATFLGISTYLIKQNVISIEQELIAKQKEIFQLEESIHLHKAEWSSLNRPGRLQKLVENHLTNAPLQGVQLASMDKVPLREAYSTSSDKVVTLASAK
ncbi:MAG: cell division protein FtsL [Janthinobacterium lividum]